MTSMSKVNYNQNDKSDSVLSLAVGAAIVLILVTGLIHLVETPDNLSEAPYKGVLFALNGLGAFIAAVGIYRGARSWGWGLGLLIAAGAVAGYVMSRTVGLPGLAIDDAWFEPLGVLSIIVEVGFVAVSAWALLAVKRLSSAQS